MALAIGQENIPTLNKPTASVRRRYTVLYFAGIPFATTFWTGSAKKKSTTATNK